MIIIKTENSIAEYSTVYVEEYEPKSLDLYEPNDDGTLDLWGVRSDGEEILFGSYKPEICKRILNKIESKLLRPVVETRYTDNGAYYRSYVPIVPVFNLPGFLETIN